MTAGRSAAHASAGGSPAPIAVIVGSYVPDGVAVLDAGCSRPRKGVRAFYDIDTPVTLAASPRRRSLSRTRADSRVRPVSLLHRRPDARRARTTVRRAPCRARCIAPWTTASTTRPMRRSAGISAISAPTAPTGSRRWNGCCWNRRAACRNALRRRRAAVSGRHRLARNVERIEHLPPAEHAGFYAAQRFTLEHHPRGHDRRRLVTERAAVRGGRVRHAHHQRPLAGPDRLAAGHGGNPDRRQLRSGDRGIGCR